jgi:two-component system response regulator FixJ
MLMSETPPTVFLVDDDPSVRDAVKWLVESVDLTVEVFGSAPDFLENFQATRPGCLVLDVRMPGMSGLELQQVLNARDCGIPVIVITGHGDVPMCVRAFENGAFAFLEKPVNHQQLLEYIQRGIEEDARRRLSPTKVDVEPLLQQLTQREREVMDLLVGGKSMKQIASQLKISVPTCSKHRARLQEKLGVENDVELVRLILTGKPPQ